LNLAEFESKILKFEESYIFRMYPNDHWRK
jgi:hypothetical protein